MLANAQNMETIGEGWRSYGLYGLTIATDFPFASYLAPGEGGPDLTFTCVGSPPVPGGLEKAEPIYASPPDLGEQESAVFLYRLEGCLALRCEAIDFYLWPDRIVCHLEDPERRPFVEVLLLGVVLACWLEWRGVPTLHASAAVINGGIVAFLADSGDDKSSIAAALVQAGHQLLTDDLMPVERSDGDFVGRPGYPQVRVWPDQAWYLLGGYEDLEPAYPSFSKRRVPVGESGFGAFCADPRPLARLYLPERRSPAGWGTRVLIEPLSAREGLMALIGSSFPGRIVEALGLHAQRLGFFSGMASRIPVRRIVYPNGPEYLPRVRNAILEDPVLSGMAR